VTHRSAGRSVRFGRTPHASGPGGVSAFPRDGARHRTRGTGGPVCAAATVAGFGILASIPFRWPLRPIPAAGAFARVLSACLEYRSIVR